MNNFGYRVAASIPDALEALESGASVLAGGTDLLPLMKDEIVSPLGVVDIGGWLEGNGVKQASDHLVLGATTPLSRIASDPDVKRDLAALAQACSVSASPQLRNMGTIGGNLLQQTRCWYYRGEHQCWLKGGELCYARHGENELHAIFLNSPAESKCVSAHPSDPAVALLALDAVVHGESPAGAFEVPLEQLFALPTDDRRNFVQLPPAALITEIHVPTAPGMRSVYLKSMQRAAWAFAMASVAVVLRLSGDTIAGAHVALGGVAPVPLRALWVESLLVGGTLASLDREAIADALVAPATPLSQNGYKVPLLRDLFLQALDQV